MKSQSSDPRSFLQIFSGVVEKHREKDAIVTEGRHKVTYGQLFSKASEIAQQLKDAGIAPEEPVGIGISKSAEYIACMLGCWMAGAAFVPLDPVLPKERAQFIINQSKMRTVLMKSGAGRHLEGLGIKTITVGENWQLTEQSSKHSLEILPESLAYIIYTSGSTGRPKGVMVTHSGICNFLSAQIEAFRFDENSNSLFVLSTNFDASVSDIGCALLAGSTLFIEPPGLLAPGPHFLDLLIERNITHIDIPPSLLKTIPSEHAPPSLKTIIIGGEACAPDVVRAWAKKCLVVNVYGPTETTVCSSLGACDAETWDRPLIGQPFKNVDYYILDENQKPVPVGTPGELYIGGIQVARGYVEEPELTDRKFVCINGKRLYRTGDLIVHCHDGEYQFLGRVDRQFKLRGMLVEPEEIEGKLSAHPKVARAAVLKRPLRAGFSGDKLIAFVQPKEGQSLESSNLKQFLAKYLPKWMVPQIFEITEQLPITVTGKIDLSKLREIELSTAAGAVASEPTTRTQEVLVEVWKQIFGSNSIGINDDFFDLGGDSLNIIEAVLAAHLHGLTISPDSFVSHSTISELSEVIERRSIFIGSEREGTEELGLSTQLPENALDSDFLRADVLQELQSQVPHSTRQSQPQSKRSAMENVFITGATGFLGARLLHELLKSTDANMFCSVRANSEESAMRRLEHALQLHGISLIDDYRKRITPILGDLTTTNLGMSSDKWKELTSTIDTVFHSAATVNMVKDYFELKPANVLGTREIARFVLEGKPKHLHYASTLSVFVATNCNTGVAEESDHLERPFTVFGGYAQTKFAAELIVRTLHSTPVSIYRFGLLTGDTHTGKSAKDDFLNMFARGIKALGYVPEFDSNMSVDVTPVDYAAQAMALISIADTQSGNSNTYHIANDKSLTLSEFLSVLKKMKIKLESLPAQEFLKKIQKDGIKLNAEESAACLALCRALGDQQSFDQFRTMDLFQATDIRFDCTNTKKALAGTNITCPQPTKELIELYLQHALK